MEDAPAATGSSQRRIAIWVGVLYLIATIAPVLTLGAWGTLVDEPGILTNAAANESQPIMVALLNLVMAIAVAGVAFMIYPILMRVANSSVEEGLAHWYVGTRITEGAIFVVAVLGTMAFLPLSQEFLAAGSPNDSYFQTSAIVLEFGIDLAYALGQTVFAVGAGMLYYLMFRSRIVPRWLSLWGLIASPLFVVASLSLLWTSDPNTAFSTVLYVPTRTPSTAPRPTGARCLRTFRRTTSGPSPCMTTKPGRCFRRRSASRVRAARRSRAQLPRQMQTDRPTSTSVRARRHLWAAWSDSADLRQELEGRRNRADRLRNDTQHLCVRNRRVREEPIEVGFGRPVRTSGCHRARFGESPSESLAPPN